VISYYETEAELPPSSSTLALLSGHQLLRRLRPSELRASHIQDIDGRLFQSGLARSTKASRAGALRRVLRWLWENHNAPKLDGQIRRYTGVRPRNNTATREEINRILSAAPPHLKLYTLLCSDLAIRSGTAALLSPQNYNRQSRSLHFISKGGATLTLPVTEDVRRMTESCDLDSSQPFVAQLWTGPGTGCKPGPDTKWGHIMRRAFTRLRKRLNFNRRIIPHDLRRTAAVAMLEATGDLRDVQAFLGHLSLHSTVIYLDHDLRPVKRHTLELIKRPRVEESEEQFA